MHACVTGVKPNTCDVISVVAEFSLALLGLKSTMRMIQWHTSRVAMSLTVTIIYQRLNTQP
jgi:hypothetical protein